MRTQQVVKPVASASWSAGRCSPVSAPNRVTIDGYTPLIPGQLQRPTTTARFLVAAVHRHVKLLGLARIQTPALGSNGREERRAIWSRLGTCVEPHVGALARSFYRRLESALPGGGRGRRPRGGVSGEDQ